MISHTHKSGFAQASARVADSDAVSELSDLFGKHVLVFLDFFGRLSQVRPKSKVFLPPGASGNYFSYPQKRVRPSFSPSY